MNPINADDYEIQTTSRDLDDESDVSPPEGGLWSLVKVTSCGSHYGKRCVFIWTRRKADKAGSPYRTNGDTSP